MRHTKMAEWMENVEKTIACIMANKNYTSAHSLKKYINLGYASKKQNMLIKKRGARSSFLVFRTHPSWLTCTGSATPMATS